MSPLPTSLNRQDANLSLQTYVGWFDDTNADVDMYAGRQEPWGARS